MEHETSKLETINWILHNFYNMGATGEQLEQEKLAMLNDEGVILYNLYLLDDGELG